MSNRASTKLSWLVNRTGAGVAAAALTGTLVGIVAALYTGFTRGAEGAEPVAAFIWMVSIATLGASVLGAPSAVLVMCFSRAKVAPWRSIPVFLSGAVVGFVVLVFPIEQVLDFHTDPRILLVLAIVGPTLGALFSLGLYSALRGESSDASRQRWSLFSVPVGAALALLWLGSIGLSSDIAAPAIGHDKAEIMALERRAWGDVATQINDVIVVQRGDYAAVSTNIDVNNIALYRHSTSGWHRITPNGWRDDVNVFDFQRVGMPWATANALVNGVRRQWHIAGIIQV